ncbi:MAG: ABC transporter permease [Mesorhizobium sp.]|nr:MAG: ABC transporter permease [Mesorhizobium sp.]
MSALLAWLLSNPTVLAIGAGVIAAAGAWFKGRLSGAKAERNKQAAEEAEARTEGQRIDDAVAGRSPDVNRERLGKWSRQ